MPNDIQKLFEVPYPVADKELLFALLKTAKEYNMVLATLKNLLPIMEVSTRTIPSWQRDSAISFCYSTIQLWQVSFRIMNLVRAGEIILLYRDIKVPFLE